MRTHTRARGCVPRKSQSASRAEALARCSTASSRSTMTASAPLASALGMRSGREAGTNNAVRTTECITPVSYTHLQFLAGNAAGGHGLTLKPGYTRLIDNLS